MGWKAASLSGQRRVARTIQYHRPEETELNGRQCRKPVCSWIWKRHVVRRRLTLNRADRLYLVLVNRHIVHLEAAKMGGWPTSRSSREIEGSARGNAVPMNLFRWSPRIAQGLSLGDIPLHNGKRNHGTWRIPDEKQRAADNLLSAHNPPADPSPNDRNRLRA